MIKKILWICFLITSLAISQIVPPKISLSENGYDFGNIVRGSVVSHKFFISNTGGSLLKLSDIHTSFGRIITSLSNNEIKPGKDAVLVVHFDADYKMGPQKNYVFITTNDPDNSYLKLKITANVVSSNNLTGDSTKTLPPKAYFLEKTHDFGEVKAGSIKQYFFHFKNAGKSVLKIKKIRTSCGCTAALVSSNKISPGGKATIHVELDTRGMSGKISRSILLYTNDPSAPLITLMIYANVKKDNK